MLAVGGLYFTITLEWWVLPLTLVTYAALVFLATRAPAGLPPGSPTRSSRQSPDERVRRLPRGETRQRVIAALEAHGRVMLAIEASDGATRAALTDAVPKLRRVIDLLLDVAEAKERTAHTPRLRGGRRGGDERAARTPEPGEGSSLADAELSEAAGRLLALRSEVVRLSIEDGEEATARASEITRSLDAWNRRLDALYTTLRDQ